MLFIQFQLNASALTGNYMNKCHRITGEGHNVGSTVGDSLLPLSVAVQYLCSALQKRSFIVPNIETKNLWSTVHHKKLGVAQQVIVLYGCILKSIL
jgi:hypothetical protein